MSEFNYNMLTGVTGTRRIVKYCQVKLDTTSYMYCLEKLYNTSKRLNGKTSNLIPLCSMSSYGNGVYLITITYVI